MILLIMFILVVVPVNKGFCMCAQNLLLAPTLLPTIHELDLFKSVLVNVFYVSQVCFDWSISVSPVSCSGVSSPF